MSRVLPEDLACKGAGKRRWSVTDVVRLSTGPIALTIAIGALAIAVSVLEVGVIHRTEIKHGPFDVARGGETPIVALPLRPGGWLGARPDDAEAEASRLRLFIDGQEYAAPHADDERIQAGEAFRHQGDTVFAALPAGANNDVEAVARLTYPVQFRSRSIALAALPALLAAWIFGVALRCAPSRLGRILALPAMAFSGGVWVAFAAALAYGAVTLWAWATGWGLPATAAIRLSVLAAVAARGQAWISPALMSCATVGLLCRWIAAMLRADPEAIDRAETRLTRLLERLGFPVLLGLALLWLGAVWSGLRVQNEYSIFSLVGLVPFSDAGGYWADVNRFMRVGSFGVEGARHPMAQMTRTALAALAGLDYASTLLLQAALVTSALYAAARAVGRWLGPWASIVFVAQCLAFTGKFLPSMATESPGFAWALAATAFAVSALGRASAVDAVLASLSMTMALAVRMGAMFTIPAMLAWTALLGGERRRRRRLGAATLAGMFAVVALNTLLGHLLTREPIMAGSNFAYTVCGMTIGADWSECPRRYRPELAPADQQDENALVALMLVKAKGHFLANPSVFFRSLWASLVSFLDMVPSTVVGGLYAGRIASPLLTLLLVVGAGGLLAQFRSMPRREMWFWALFWTSTLASAALVYGGDGRRTMSASYPLAALFLARGFTTALQSPAPIPSPISGRFGPATAWAIPGIAVVAILVAPFMARTGLGSSSGTYADVPVDATHQLVFGRPRMTGILVEGDGVRLPKGTGSVHLSDFTRLVGSTNLQDYQNIISPPPSTPFGFVMAPAAARSGADEIWYIVPPEVMTRKDVVRWSFALEPFGVKPGGVYWFKVSKATPLER